jgi:DDE domain
MPLVVRHPLTALALVGFQGRGCAHVVQPNCCHPFLLEALLFQWPSIRRCASRSMGKPKTPESNKSVDFLLTEHRDKEAALRFLKKAIRRNGVPETITIDGSDANEAAIKSYNEKHGTAITIRKRKYLNNVVEQDHRGVKRITRPMLGFKAFDAAQSTLVGIELMHMIRKRQLVVEEGNEGLTAAELFYSLAA